jgi:hypothetical protein
MRRGDGGAPRGNGGADARAQGSRDGGNLGIEYVVGAPGDDRRRLSAWLELPGADPAELLRRALKAWLTRASIRGITILRAAWRPGIHYCADRASAMLLSLINANRNPRCKIHDAIALTSCIK